MRGAVVMRRWLIDFGGKYRAREDGEEKAAKMRVYTVEDEGCYPMTVMGVSWVELVQ